MGCSAAGIISVLSIGIATVLSALAFGLPLWTTSSFTGTKNQVTTRFAASVWGYCTDFTVKDDADSSASRCVLFHSSSKFHLPNMTDDDEDFAKAFQPQSVCSAYQSAKKGDDLFYFVEAHANAVGLRPEYFSGFLRNSCGTVGWITLIFASVCASLGVLAFIFVTLSITCCKKQSTFITVGKWMIFGASLSGMVTFIFWIIQWMPLVVNAKLNASFYMEIIATLFYIIAGVLVARHNRMH